MKKNRVHISAHHGDVARPNELKWARRVCEQNSEIDCLEIDFVTFREEVRSSHDYDEQMIAQGSQLSEWLAFTVPNGIQLWIDVKQNLSLYFNWMYGEFDVRLFFDTLRRAHEDLSEQGHTDTRATVWIGCQDRELLNRLNEFNHKLQRHNRWKIVLDLPTIGAYVYQTFVPHCLMALITRRAESDITSTETDYKHYDVISLDQSFWDSVEELCDFIKRLKLNEGTTVILNSYPRNVEAPRIKGIRIVMQYDYEARCKKNEK
jgi:hypothetical protein